MKKLDIKHYYVEDAIFINHELTEIAKEMWTGQEIIDTLINRSKIGWKFEIKILDQENSIAIINSIDD